MWRPAPHSSADHRQSDARTAAAWPAEIAQPRYILGLQSPQPVRGSPPTAPLQSWDAFRACGVWPSRKPCHGDRHNTGADWQPSWDDQTNIAAHAERPEVPVLGLIKLVKLHAWTRRIQLQIKGCGLDGLLLLAGQFGEAVGEGVGDAEVRHVLRRSRNRPNETLWSG